MPYTVPIYKTISVKNALVRASMVSYSKKKINENENIEEKSKSWEPFRISFLLLVKLDDSCTYYKK